MIAGLLFAVLMISVMSSDAEGRAAARQWLARRTRWLVIPLVILWAVLLWPLIERYC